MGWNAENQSIFVGLNLGPTMEAKGFGNIKIMIMVCVTLENDNSCIFMKFALFDNTDKHTVVQKGAERTSKKKPTVVGQF